jgi:L-aspartate oxidase
VLWLGAGSSGQQPLISVAVRGEGAFLVDVDGDRVMAGVHELADLAPRDVVARAIVARMQSTGTDHVFLDARHLGRDFVERRFPSIVQRCRELGFDPASELVPVAPAQHYASGGVVTGLLGRSSLPGLSACGEVACSGVHGANRLASNSLLEGLVFAHRIADDLSERLAAGHLPFVDPVEPRATAGLLDPAARVDVQRAMTAGSGAVRSAESTSATAARLAELAERQSDVPSSAAWETTNLHQVGAVLTEVARRREESRGGHVRSDFPERDDEHWRGHQTVRLDDDGVVQVSYAPVPEPAEQEVRA